MSVCLRTACQRLNQSRQCLFVVKMRRNSAERHFPVSRSATAVRCSSLWKQHKL